MSNATTNTVGSSDAQRHCANALEAPELRQLKKLAGAVNKLGLNFAAFGADGQPVLVSEAGAFQSDPERLAEYGCAALRKDSDQGCPESDDSISSFGEPARVLAAVLNLGGRAVAVALVDLGQSRTNVADAEGLNRDSGAESSRTNVDYVRQILAIFQDGFGAERKTEDQIEKVSTELAQTYEELVLLHKLSTNMKVTESDLNYLQMACDSLTDIVSVEGIAVFLERPVDDGKRLVLCAGSGLIDVDEHATAILQSRLADEIAAGKEALLDSEVDSPFRFEWPPNIQNIIAVPLYGTDRGTPHLPGQARAGNLMMGLMVAVNRLDKPDFDSTDIKLFNSVANGCAVFVENGRLFRDLKELFIGSLKALTNSIDAKDQYTRGHSERVAFMSRWIGERLAEHQPLQEEQIHKFYLAGLLHDIGKVGIAEAVLRKKGKLTEQEVNHIRAHPSIGAGILGEIKQMRDIVPGVLCHHERVDGKGYPNGLTGDQIPLVGKIVGLADGFDAMTSKRIYRDAMTVEQALTEIEKQLGSQFDERVGRIFINSNVYQLWDIVQDGFTEVHEKGDFSEYGTIAVGTLVR
ncbi:MAG TPA: HD domain-containing phosphohydrolase [Sedimentisphaerales bacterium]|nr:HD domain-containing phosphohydrolase [Sedimentisphaerales bacterium]